MSSINNGRRSSSVADGVSRTDDGAAAPRTKESTAVSWEDTGGMEDVNMGAADGSKIPQQHIMHKSHAGEHHGDHGEVFKATTATLIYAACAALNSCNLGYDIGVNTDAALKLQKSMDLSDVQIEIFMGSLNLFAMLGALFSHVISDRIGRRGAFLVAAVGFILGIIIMISAQSYVTLMFGRVFVGLGVGFGLAVDPVYIAEVSPAAHRGGLVTWSEIATNIGIVFGFMSGLFFYSKEENIAWRGMFSLGLIMPSILIVLVCLIMPESPRWLVQKKREAEACEVLKKVYPPGYDIDAVVADIKTNIERDTEAEHAIGWDVILFPSPAFRRMLLVGIGTAVAQQAVGIDAIQYFLVYILDQSGIEGDLAKTGVLICLGLIKLFFILIAGRLFDRKGRRPLMIFSCAGMCLACLCLSINFLLEEHSPGFAVFALALYLSLFSLGMGPGAWLIPSEVFATTIRAKAMSVATFMNRVTATVLSSTFLSTANAMSWAGFFLLLAIVCIVVGLFFFMYLPETKGRSLEDMSLYFAELTGDRSILEVEERIHHDQQQVLQEETGTTTVYVQDRPNPRATTVGTMI